MNNIWSLFLLSALIFTAPAHAKDEAAKEVNVYSYRQSFLLKPLFDEFTKQTNINVNLVSASKGLNERIIAEGKGGSADLLFTSNYGRIADAVDAGITQTISDELIKTVPAALRDNAKQWLPLTLRARILYVSKTRIPANTINDYSDLTDAKWRGKICTRSGTHDYNLALLGSFIHHWGKPATKQWLTDVKNNLARKPQGNDRAQVKAIKNGHCDIAIGNSYYYGLMLNNDEQKAWAQSVRLVFPNQNGSGTHMNISGAVLLKHAKNKDNAEKLLAFMLSKNTQEKYAEQNFEYPVLAEAQWSDLLQSWGDFKRDDSPLADIYQARKKAFILVNQTGFNN